MKAITAVSKYRRHVWKWNRRLSASIAYDLGIRPNGIKQTPAITSFFQSGAFGHL